MLNNVIKELEELRGKEVEIFGSKVTLDGKPSDEDFVIDTVDVLENIYDIRGIEEIIDFSYPCYIGYLDEEYEITLENGAELEAENIFYKVSDVEEMLERYNISIEYFFENAVNSGDKTVFVDENGDKYYDIEFDDDISVEAEDEDDYIEQMQDIWYVKELVHNNTYNRSAPLNHHIDYQIYENVELGEYYMLLKCHRYGDVRCNYTDYVLLKADERFEFDEIFFYKKEIEFDMQILNEEEEEEEVSVKCILEVNSNDMIIELEGTENYTYVRDSIEEVKEYINEEIL